MSIQSNVGAESAAEELKKKAERLKGEHPEAEEALDKLIAEADSIIRTARAGWY